MSPISEKQTNSVKNAKIFQFQFKQKFKEQVSSTIQKILTAEKKKLTILFFIIGYKSKNFYC